MGRGSELRSLNSPSDSFCLGNPQEVIFVRDHGVRAGRQLGTPAAGYPPGNDAIHNRGCQEAKFHETEGRQGHRRLLPPDRYHPRQVPAVPAEVPTCWRTRGPASELVATGIELRQFCALRGMTEWLNVSTLPPARDVFPLAVSGAGKSLGMTPGLVTVNPEPSAGMR